MIPAKLIKELELKGFSLEFPKYKSNDELIIDILKQKNLRLNLAIPLLLRGEFNYLKIIKKIPDRGDFDKIILISFEIFKKFKINSDYISSLIKSEKIKVKISESEFNYYYDSFKESNRKISRKEEDSFKEQIGLRKGLDINQALAKIFSPGKIRIMKKIFNHEKLSNTELKYYYRSIKPLIVAISNDDMKSYLNIVGSTKKYR